MLFSGLLALHGPSLRRVLKAHYRFCSKINAFPPATIYDDKLIPDESVAGSMPSDLEGMEGMMI
jgi:DNA polymerase alpha-associated DNA helicase A